MANVTDTALLYRNNIKINKDIKEGVVVIDAVGDSGAAKAGLKKGDIITKIDNVELNKMSDLRKYIYTKNVGDRVMLMINRNGRNFGIEIDLGKK